MDEIEDQSISQREEGNKFKSRKEKESKKKKD